MEGTAEQEGKKVRSDIFMSWPQLLKKTASGSIVSTLPTAGAGNVVRAVCGQALH